LQHFSRELARYFRNLLVAKIAGSDTRLIAGSPGERARLKEMAGAFSEEDLTRYLQLSLDLFRDLQASLQPRFHLEIGLMKLVQAGRLTSIEEALAGLEKPAAEAATPRRRGVETKTAAPPPRTGPSPFEQDRAKKATARPEPQSIGATALAPEPVGAIDWREKLHAALMELGMTFTADAVEHSEVTETGNVLQFVTPKKFMLAMRGEDIAKGAQRASGRMFQIKVTPGEVQHAEAAAGTTQPPDDVSRRALENPEVKKYLEVFGAGEVRAVRDLKKIE
jgi:DNA polymerase-3 subunit gamma/tau